jgi:molybdate transport system substrate-binding protein
VKVIISGGFEKAYRQALPEFEKATGIAVDTGSGASQGKGPLTIASQLERGEPADVVICSREGLAELTAAGRIVAGSDVDLGLAALGAAVRAGAPKPDVGSVEGLKRALLAAKTVAVPQSTSGIYLMSEIFPRLKIAGRISVRVTERGQGSVALVAEGKADIALQPVSELVNVPGIDYVGRLPDEVQLIQTFAGAIVKGSQQAGEARQLLRFLASERASAAIKNNGMDLPRRAS